MTNILRTRGFKPVARFGVSLQPEIFYALQVFSAADGRIHSNWKARALERFPPPRWPITLPGAIWTAVPDALEMEPTLHFATIITALQTIPLRDFQERILTGMLHQQQAALKLLDDGMPLNAVVASLPRTKREWLGHVGLYPIDPIIAESLDRLLRSPEEFRAGVVEMVRVFWDSVFAETWEEVLPRLRVSVARMEQLYEECSFGEFLRHTLLPVELNEKRQVLRALRGGYEIRLSRIEQCTLTPSIFNDSRFWTSYSHDGLQELWFPYFEPDIRPVSDKNEGDLAVPAPDIALIFKAMGDATRFAMASLIGRKPLSAVELASALSVSKPTVSHHLHIMRSAGLIHETDHGGSVLISLNADILRRLSRLTIDRLLESREQIEIQRSRRTT